MNQEENSRTVNIKWTKIIVAVVTATITLIGTLGTIYLKHYLSQKENNDPITRRLESSQKLNTRLKKILKRANASRVTVAQFHNGSEFTSGRNYDKISTTHQVVSPGVSHTENRVNDLPITLFEDVLSKTGKNNYVHYGNILSIPNVGSIFREEGVESVYIFKLESVDGEYMGVMIVEYTENNMTLSDSTVEKIKQDAQATGAFLSSE